MLPKLLYVFDVALTAAHPEQEFCSSNLPRCVNVDRKCVSFNSSRHSIKTTEFICLLISAANTSRGRHIAEPGVNVSASATLPCVRFSVLPPPPPSSREPPSRAHTAELQKRVSWPCSVSVRPGHGAAGHSGVPPTRSLLLPWGSPRGPRWPLLHAALSLPCCGFPTRCAVTVP